MIIINKLSIMRSARKLCEYKLIIYENACVWYSCSDNNHATNVKYYYERWMRAVNDVSCEKYCTEYICSTQVYERKERLETCK